MQFPSEITNLIKEFMLLPRNVFIVKRDFYNQLRHAQISILLNMLRTFEISTIQYNNQPISLSRFNALRIPVLETQKILADTVFALCGNDTVVLMSLGTHFHHCLYNNIHNWTNRSSVGDICNVFNCIIVYENITYSKSRKGIIIDKKQLWITIALYDYIIVVDPEDPDLLHLSWLPNTIHEYNITAEKQFVLEKTLKDLYRNDADEVLWDDTGFSFYRSGI
jgi:hypothetical protein